LEVGGAVDDYILVSLRRGEAMEISASTMDIDNRVITIFGGDTWKSDVELFGGDCPVSSSSGKLVTVDPASH